MSFPPPIEAGFLRSKTNLNRSLGFVKNFNLARSYNGRRSSYPNLVIVGDRQLNSSSAEERRNVYELNSAIALTTLASTGLVRSNLERASTTWICMITCIRSCFVYTALGSTLRTLNKECYPKLKSDDSVSTNFMFHLVRPVDDLFLIGEIGRNRTCLVTRLGTCSRRGNFRFVA